MNVTDALLGEHGAFYAQFDRIDADLPGATAVAEVREQAALLAAALVSHARLEDELLFAPLLGAGGDAGLLGALEEEHERIAALLAQAQGSADAGRARDALLEAVALARDHFAKEERLAFPLAATLLGDARLSEIGAAWAGRRAVWLDAGGP